MDETIGVPENGSLPERVKVCDIHFRTGTKTYYFDPNGLTLKPGDHVIIETSRGPEFGYCSSAAHEVPGSAVVAPLRKVLRRATEKDEYLNEDNRRQEKAAYAFCQERIEKLGLEMQLVSCEYAFDGSKILFYFTADGRVDFRELVRQLASNFHTRVELRQIGVRDKAKMVGGLGICGRPFCCGQFLSDFAPVSIKMAKTQNLSLNPTKISGTCGRLMCCLKYEQEAYEDLLKTSPKAESFVDTPEGRGTVVDVDLMRQSVKVRMESDPEQIQSFRNEQIAVFRSGKAKKTDAPIPSDWAPISGEQKKSAPKLEEYPRFERATVRRVEQPTAEPAPETVREEAAPQVEEETPAQREWQKKSRKRGGKNRKKQNPEQAAQKQEKPAQEPNKQAPKQEKAAPKQEKQAQKSPKQASKQQKQAPRLEKPLPMPQSKPTKQAAPAKPQESAAPAAEAKPADAAQNTKKRRYYHKPKKTG